jgi:cell division protein FtsQ
VKRALLAGAGLLLGAAIATAPLWAPPRLQGLESFAVQRVEVSGTRLLAPQEVLALLAAGNGSVWDDLAVHESRLAEHPVIAEARVTRRLPGTLRVRVHEKQPVALLEGRSLRLATADGEVLPIDPARVPLDLPLVRGERRVEDLDQAVREVLAELGRLAAIDPTLGSRISEIRMSSPGEMIALLVEPSVEVVLPVGADLSRLLQLRAVLVELARDGRAGGSPARVDLRFHDQVVVRFSPPA